ncbi:hypothetical protein [Rubellimicrobium arenae]|uniref:hypothetical protein n=1 Tax=Rubellimicrobium arenae TaxID=2817372 RepID=UPI001B30B047|nr:hypothetical protein [Rubellimicrobium arenae]
MGSIYSFSDFLAALRRQVWIILIVVIAGLPAVYWYATSRPIYFEAKAVLGVEEMQAAQTGLNVNRQLDEIQQALMSRDNIVMHVRNFDLFPDLQSENEKVSLTREAIAITKLMDPAQAWRPDAQPYGLSITVRLDDAAQAAAFANALLNSIVSEDARRARAREASTLDRAEAMLAYLDREEKRVTANIDSIEEEIANYRAIHVDSLPESLQLQRDQLSRLTSDRIELDQKLIEFDGGPLGQLRSNVAERQRALLTEQREVIVQAIADSEAALAAAPGVQRELNVLTRRLQGLEGELDSITAQRTEAAMNQYLAEQTDVGYFTVLETAVPPELPVSANKRKIALAGGMAVFAAAFGLALGRELMHQVIRNATQMQRQLGIQPVVVIPQVTSRAAARRRMGLVALFVGLLVVTVFNGKQMTSEISSLELQPTGTGAASPDGEDA